MTLKFKPSGFAGRCERIPDARRATIHGMRIAEYLAGENRSRLGKSDPFDRVSAMMTLLNPDTFWLVATNLLLGAAILLCCGAIAWCILRDVQEQRRHRRDESLSPHGYLDTLRTLGIVFPDGSDTSERIDEMVKD